MKDYLKKVFREASETGAPVMRPLFFEFPEEKRAWEIGDEYMLGGDLLVAPVLYEGMRRRTVYLPECKWERFPKGGEVLSGGEYEVDAPLDVIPVFRKLS